jgi:hypothetical protein
MVDHMLAWLHHLAASSAAAAAAACLNRSHAHVMPQAGLASDMPTLIYDKSTKYV